MRRVDFGIEVNLLLQLNKKECYYIYDNKQKHLLIYQLKESNK